MGGRSDKRCGRHWVSVRKVNWLIQKSPGNEYDTDDDTTDDETENDEDDDAWAFGNGL
ncbi:uncharacterized protein BDZ99DRAFT_462526 [Mytilinidion resinicola]|uniref:Uncharacterized protein n=1 Tax=Mytilinidion resinicola TaxID=574789 RepID=A0A6A6YLW3_9PEZI|nr:uncharacterized protein BDZ99DRAFT_462526 [Mytilinidion resinicola]KAF2809866.1 hypothetical protein BDZ99DRAFT_462526 [Mytilinidion resinicola]